ncbi:Preprotein translocase secY subunit [Anopheles sinensis]|uniref:Preprotein translocase secY subunit n=1 Tax=Anopheles sinensis TaxID=74873 RepID=A0A084VJ19_ANOSI|nr:Preprotein translocase secY subunit [Anopheles sinensis]
MLPFFPGGRGKVDVSGVDRGQLWKLTSRRGRFSRAGSSTGPSIRWLSERCIDVSTAPGPFLSAAYIWHALMRATTVPDNARTPLLHTTHKRTCTHTYTFTLTFTPHVDR